MKNAILIILLVANNLFADAQETSPVPKTIPVKNTSVTFLYGTKTFKREGDVAKNNGDFLRFKGAATAEWKINVAVAGDYQINVEYGLRSDEAQGRPIDFNYANTILHYNLLPTQGAFGPGTFQKIVVKDMIRLAAGEQVLSFATKETAPNKNLLDFRRIGLIPAAAIGSVQADKENATKSRSNSDWMVKAHYGVMFHYTSQSIGSDGTHKPYEQAINSFNLGAFVNMVEATGAGYVIFTIGHAEPFCPAPLKSWEKYHPGHTTKRDLINEMADALALKNIKLLCYLPTHVVAKYQKVTEKEFTRINKEVMTEMGTRYGKKIAGYWFDGWYQCFEEYPGFSFRDFFKTCKTGNSDRLIALNTWIYPQVTDWQEYWAGETASPVELPIDGVVKDGPATGLRYQTLLIMEPYWVQEKAAVDEPRFTPEKLSDYIRKCNQNNGAVTINLGIYQDGTIGVKALEVMKEVRKLAGR